MAGQTDRRKRRTLVARQRWPTWAPFIGVDWRVYSSQLALFSASILDARPAEAATTAAATQS